MDDLIRGMFVQQEAFERAANPLAQFRELLGAGSSLDLAQLALERELETRTSLLRDVSGILGAFAPSFSHSYDTSAAHRALAGLETLRELAPVGLLTSSIGELNAGRLGRDDFATVASAYAGVHGYAAEAASMAHLQATTTAAQAAYRSAVGLDVASALAFRNAAHDEIAPWPNGHPSGIE